MTDRSQERFLALLESHQNIVFKVASIYCWDSEERRDLIQEITMQLWRAFPSYDEKRVFSTWMYRIALNVAISSARKAGRLRRLVAPLENSDIGSVPGPPSPSPTNGLTPCIAP
jgi:RNA polymerase sigma-70 factor (ECF subfamily)